MTDTLPDGSSFDTHDLERLFRRFHFPATAVGNDTGSFFLPESWQPFALETPPGSPELGGPPVVLAQFNEPASSNMAFAQVLAARLPRDIAARHWLGWFLDQMDYKLQEIAAVSERVADSLAGIPIGRNVYAGRVCVRFYDELAIVVIAATPAPRYAQDADMLAVVVRSLVLGNRRPGGVIEERRTVHATAATAGAAPAGIVFQCPMSWTPSVETDLAEGRGVVDLESFDDSHILSGFVRLKWIDGVDRVDEAEHLRAMGSEIRSLGLKTGQAFHVNRTPQSLGSLRMDWQKIYHAQIIERPKETPMEVWLSSLTAGSTKIFALLLTPSRQENALGWAINRRALEIVCQTLAPAG